MGKSARKNISLKSGRPPLTTKSTLSTASSAGNKRSSRATRTIIRAHHNLHKSRAKAVSEGNHALVAELDEQIQQVGGLEAYQKASLTGQSKDRGGDSSVLLVKWLEEDGLVGKASVQRNGTGLRVLEVGALSSRNAISAMVGKGVDVVKRLDLKSQELGLIEEIDFMDLPIPQSDNDRYDVVSLSLVLNYVPETDARGEMLKRTRKFLRTTQKINPVPCLFFVLPLPCVSNSRYMTVDRLCEIMASLGYYSVKRHQSSKLHYELFRFDGAPAKSVVFKKLEVNPGKGRNNFCITVPND